MIGNEKIYHAGEYWPSKYDHYLENLSNDQNSSIMIHEYKPTKMDGHDVQHQNINIFWKSRTALALITDT